MFRFAGVPPCRCHAADVTEEGRAAQISRSPSGAAGAPSIATCRCSVGRPVCRQPIYRRYVMRVRWGNMVGVVAALAAAACDHEWIENEGRVQPGANEDDFT